ncbi:Phospholipid--sterol O-acyltransferase [Vitis vinifera]|uniref:Phospholipid--sterol O-acyltransferase n=1 Tax=Vitis vinifera TaxID=29760 RepID=A0A438KD17_VITVI|nr:Phospholipid--sterol O-acyltransferase [Vitis vinifera]
MALFGCLLTIHFHVDMCSSAWCSTGQVSSLLPLEKDLMFVRRELVVNSSVPRQQSLSQHCAGWFAMRWLSLCWFSPHRAQRRRAPSVDIALLLEVEDLVVTLSTPFILMGVANFSSEGLVVDFLEDHPRDTESTDLDVASENMASENGIHIRDMMRDGSFSYLKDHRAASLSKKRKPSSTSQFDRELQKLGLLIVGLKAECLALLRNGNDRDECMFSRSLQGVESFTLNWNVLLVANHRNIVRSPVLMRELWLQMWHDIHPDAKSKFVTKAKRGPLRHEDCYWDYGKARCAWPEYCEYRYVFGDVHLGQSCRLRNSSADMLLHYV